MEQHKGSSSLLAKMAADNKPAPLQPSLEERLSQAFERFWEQLEKKTQCGTQILPAAAIPKPDRPHTTATRNSPGEDSERRQKRRGGNRSLAADCCALLHDAATLAHSAPEKTHSETAASLERLPCSIPEGTHTRSTSTWPRLCTTSTYVTSKP
ncbi:Hypothetical predicted protein [Pelobates cultripes]|uniref:Uncharacterized protein n=1 Tax=Pelobates cultripes TaxID=61616 RepID=A0AAD1SCI5_PELCU|nr:Hypothetical predicted protein [Pelobates cultripes]